MDIEYGTEEYKRFMIFAWGDYDASGSINDCVGSSDDIADADKLLSDHCKNNSGFIDRVMIFDNVTRRVVGSINGTDINYGTYKQRVEKEEANVLEYNWKTPEGRRRLQEYLHTKSHRTNSLDFLTREDRESLKTIVRGIFKHYKLQSKDHSFARILHTNSNTLETMVTTVSNRRNTDKTFVKVMIRVVEFISHDGE